MRSLTVLAVWLLVAAPPALLAGQAVRYEVAVPAPGTALFHVSAEFPTAGRDTLLVSLPAWSPGSYDIQNYARYVRRFGARDARGRALFWDRVDKDTWRVPTGGSDRVRVEFQYLADTVDLSLATLHEGFGVFLGTNLFLFEEGRLDRPAEVRFSLPPGWRVTSALPGTGLGPYRAADYHELADAMTYLGDYALDSLRVDAKWVRIAVWPGARYTPAAARNLREAVERLVATQNRLMGGPPYDVYTIFFHLRDGPYGFGGLEHSSSHYNLLPPEAFADAGGALGGFVVPLVSHELFHLWNVKRIRPAEMWPYDYRAEQYTPLLWWSEGVTDYYADLVNLRAGLWSEDRFLESVAEKMNEVAAAPAPWSVEDGSVATWIQEVFGNAYQYYPEGSLIGLLLDVEIRDATDNARGLDDVTRALLTRFSRQGRGFTTADLLGVLRETGHPDPAGFYRRYIDGRDDLPYAAVLAQAGLTVTVDSARTPFLGVQTSPGPEGQVVITDVTEGSSAARAGVAPGDVLVRVGEVEVGAGDWGAAFRQRYAGAGGAPLTVVVQRAGRPLTLQTQVAVRTVASHAVARAAQPSERQARVWRGLAVGTTGR